MPSNNIVMRHDVCQDRRIARQDNDSLANVFSVVNRCMNGERPCEQEMLGSINTLLGMIGEERRARAGRRALPGLQPVDVQYPGADRMLPNGAPVNEPQEIPQEDAAAPDIETEQGMTRILDGMGVNQNVRAIVPQILNNVTDNGDGTFQSANGLVQIGNREQLMYMIRRTMEEIQNEVGENGQFVADVGPDLQTRLTVRDPNGRRRLVRVDAEIDNG